MYYDEPTTDRYVKGIDDDELMANVVHTESFPEFYKWVVIKLNEQPKEDREDTEHTLLNIYIDFWVCKAQKKFDA